MRNDDHDGTEAFHCTTANSTAMSAHADALVLPERPMLEATNSDLSVIAPQLIEAACRARDGDREAAREHIARAMTLFHGKPSFGPSVTPWLSKVRDAAADGCFPLVENLYDAPTTCRSLSRREAGLLRMIARGMSNKCIEKSLGITPETVKTHVKAILSKLEARTRAQAVARAQYDAYPGRWISAVTASVRTSPARS
jgi:DNA-binding NarL/FixJ family response regulator